MLVSSVACTKNFEEINTNPNKIEEGENSYLLLGAQITAARRILNDDNRGFGKWVQYFTSNINSRDAFSRNDDINDYWSYNNLYVGALPNLQAILSNTGRQPNPNYEAIAMIMKAWIFSFIVQNWGDVPYSKALQGNTAHGEDPGYLIPEYDHQADILRSLVTELEQANGKIDLTAYQIDGNADIYCHGDLVRWKKFANTLRARILLDILEADRAFAEPLLAALLADPVKYPVLESNTDDVGITWIGGAVGPYENVVMSTYRGNERTIPAASGIMHILSTRKDPRRNVWFDPAKSQLEKGTVAYTGAPPALSATNPSGFTQITIDSVSQLSVANFGLKNRQEDIITYAELLFIKAEAALHEVNVGGTAETFYNAGIEASFKKWGVENDLAAYLSQSLVSYAQAAPNDKLEYIVTQRYLAQFYQSANTFNLIRRTGFPALDYFHISADPAQAAKGFPFRLRYPHVNSSNPAWAAAAAGIELNLWGKKLWWAESAPPVKMYNNQLQTSLVAWPAF